MTVEFRPAGSPVHRAVDRISFDISSAEVVGLMGESGSGKTSLALALLGLHDRDSVAVSGSVQFLDTDLLLLDERSLREIRGAKISLIWQEPGSALCPVRRIGDQIAEVAHAHLDRSWKSCRSKAQSWLARVGLEPVSRFFAAYPHQMSGGELQRAVLAQALICQPVLLIADEPTAALDVNNQADFVRLLRDLKSELDLSVLLISHTPELQACLADRVLVTRCGCIVEEGNALDVLRDPASAYARTLLRRPAQRAAKASPQCPNSSGLPWPKEVLRS